MTGPGYTHITIPVPAVGETLLPVEPPEQSRVSDEFGLTWQRGTAGWAPDLDAPCRSWEELLTARGPLVLERWGR